VLVEPERTRYDLSFRLFGFPIRIHPLFWLGSALLGAFWLDQPGGTIYLAVWIAAVLVSILVHEMGHAIAFRWFGADSHIVLYVFGGLAVPWSAVSGRWRRVVISLAGPLAGFALLGVIYFSNYYFGWAVSNRFVLSLYISLFFINLYWGIMNLLPVFPLDGGQVSQEVCAAVSRRNGFRIAMEISIAVAGLIALYSVACELEGRRGAGWLDALPWWFPRGGWWTAILFGILAFQSYQLLQQQRWADPNWRDDDRPPWR
jgi:membrane-associated protease RseP (regulator of RpoE activity)